MRDDQPPLTEIGEVVAYQLTRSGLVVYAVIRSGLSLRRGSQVVFGREGGCAPVTVEGLACGRSDLETFTGPGKVSFVLPCEYLLIQNGTPVLSLG